MNLTTQYLIKKTDKRYKSLDNLCFLSKNLYNHNTYVVL